MVLREYTPVTQPPPSTENLADLMKCFRTYAGLTRQGYENLSQDLSEHKDAIGYAKISTHDIDKYRDNVFPKPSKRKTLILIFETVCEGPVKDSWIESYVTIEYQAKAKREKMESKKEVNELNEEKLCLVEGASPIEQRAKILSCWFKKMINHKVGFLLIIFPFLWLFLSYVKPMQLFKENKSTDSLKTAAITPASLETAKLKVVEEVKVQVIEPKELQSEEEINIQTVESTATILVAVDSGVAEDVNQTIEASYTQVEELSKGLSLEVYSLGKKFKHLPPSPEGYQVARLEFSNGGYFTFIDHAVNKNILNATIDRDSGLYYQGFIKLKGSGDFIFQLDYQSGSHLFNQSFKKCRLVLKIKEMTIFDKTVPVGQGQSYSMQNMAEFYGGLTPFSFWFTCNNLRGFTPRQDFNAYKDTSVTLYLKHPDDNQIAKVTPDVFFYKPK